MFTLTFVTIALVLTIIAIVVSEICLSVENHDLTDQLNEQIRVNKYLTDQIFTLRQQIDDATTIDRQMKPTDFTTILPPQE